MKKYRQHYDVSTYDHCLNVAYLCYKFTRKHKSLDYKSMTRAAMLHDLYLYDWRNHVKQSFFQMHAFSHPKIALNNARKVMKLNKKEEPESAQCGQTQVLTGYGHRIRRSQYRHFWKQY